MGGSGERKNRVQVGQLQKNLQQKIPCLVEVKLEFPERLGGDIAKIRWITLHYGTGDSEDDGEYYNKLEKYDFFPEHGTELETYQEIIDRVAEHYRITKEQVHLI